MSNKEKTHCYSGACGPVVQTGFQFEIYWVCKACKCEISERLKEEIEERLKKKTASNSSELKSDEYDELLELFGMTGNYNDPMD